MRCDLGSVYGGVIGSYCRAGASGHKPNGPVDMEAKEVFSEVTPMAGSLASLALAKFLFHRKL